MEDKKKTKECFVCGKNLDGTQFVTNQIVWKPVCLDCQGTDKEKALVEELSDSLSDGWFCGGF